MFLKLKMRGPHLSQVPLVNIVPPLKERCKTINVQLQPKNKIIYGIPSIKNDHQKFSFRSFANERYS